MARYKVVGFPIERVDGKEMISGKAVYGPDVKLPGMLWGKVLRSPIAHGKLMRADGEKARNLPGVRAVLTAKDVPQKRYGYLIKDETIFAVDEVRYIGDAVAAVAAVDEETAEEALSLIEAEYEELPAVFDVEAAMREGAPLVHENLANYEAGLVHMSMWTPVPGTNIAHRAVFERGDVEAAFRGADYVFEDIFRASQIHHSYMEPHAVLVDCGRGGLTVWSSTQEVFSIRSLLAELFGIPESRIRVICTKVGGGFGGKIEPRLEPYAVALSLKTGRPVKMVMTRAEEFSAAAGSTPSIVKVKTAVRKDGTLVARDVNFLWDTGAYAEGLAPSNRAVKDGAGLYRLPNIRVTSSLVYTNKVRGTQLRGLGIPEALFAIESQMDMIAEKLGLDPFDFRMKNVLDEGDINTIGGVVHSIGLKECLRKTAEAINWGKPKGDNVGRGLAVLAKSPTTHASISGAWVQLNGDGTAQVLVGASEVGQGMEVVLTQIAAEELGLPTEAVGITAADTAVSPYDAGTFSSRVTLYTGQAVRNAAVDEKSQLLEVASKITEIPASELVVEDGRIVSQRLREISLSFREVCQRAHISEKPILGRGWSGGKGDYPSRSGKAETPGWKYGAQAVELEVDRENGLQDTIVFADPRD